MNTLGLAVEAMAKRFIQMADRFIMCVAWIVVSALRLAILPLHLTSYAIWKGCDEVVTLTTEMQNATVARLKAE